MENVSNLPYQLSGIYTIAWSPDETKVCSGSRDRTVQIWNAKDGKLLHTLKGHVNW